MIRHFSLSTVAAVSFLTLAGTAQAQTATPAPATPFATSALADDALHGVAGREDTQQAATANQTAGVSHNSVGDHVQTGDAQIDGNAFQNMSGLSILNVNTGNNVAINAALNVNISLQTAP